MSTFDPQEFLDTQTTEVNDTRAAPCPVGEYQATIDSVDVKNGVSQKNGNAWTKLNVKWCLEGTDANRILEKEKIYVQQGLLLDITESGGLDMGKGKNTQLGRLRDATNLNAPGAPFSFRMLIGRSAKVKVDHREYEGNIYDDVKGVVKLA